MSVKEIAEVNTNLAAFLCIHFRILKIFLAHSSTRERVAYVENTVYECLAMSERKSSILQYNSLLYEMRRY